MKVRILIGTFDRGNCNLLISSAMTPYKRLLEGIIELGGTQKNSCLYSALNSRARAGLEVEKKWFDLLKDHSSFDMWKRKTIRTGRLGSLKILYCCQTYFHQITATRQEK